MNSIGKGIRIQQHGGVKTIGSGSKQVTYLERKEYITSIEIVIQTR
jgi:hypothetical protein